VAQQPATWAGETDATGCYDKFACFTSIRPPPLWRPDLFLAAEEGTIN